MSENNLPGYGLFVNQGWQCPICQRVYSPSTLLCFYCGNTTVTTTSTGTPPQPMPSTTSEQKERA